VSSPYGKTDQSYTVVVTADAPPICALTVPWTGQVLAGKADFYGDGLDDVGVVKGELFIDGVLAPTEMPAPGHYRFGADGLVDTTSYPDGPHKFSMVVQDTKGASCTAEHAVIIQNHPPDAGAADAASEDASVTDASVTDDSSTDAPASEEPPASDSGCGCRSSRVPEAPWVGLLFAALAASRTRRRSR
jgi:MYXO-CTERM domain-containing protein